MRNSTSTKIIKVPLPVELVEVIATLSRERGEPVEALIQEACAEYVASARDAEMDRQYIESYTKFPEKDEGDWRERVAADVWDGEDWSEEYERFLQESAEGALETK